MGVIVHFATLSLLYRLLDSGFVPSKVVATLVAMTFNFAINNVLTYRDMRLRGWHWLRGWFTFTIACTIGAIANAGIAAYLFSEGGASWPIAVLGASQV
jgi:dolichol-phosphate mannosyltransferase